MNVLLDACKRLSETIDGALLCGVVEVATGKVLALHSTDGDPRRFEDAFAYSARELLHAPKDGLSDAANGVSADRLNEVQLTSTHTCHLAKAIGDGSRLLLLVTRRDTNVGLNWAEVKATAAVLGHNP